MNIIKMKVNDLLQKKAEYNPRVELKPGDAEYEKLKKSISEFGYISPIIYNTQRQIIVGGHQRLSVLKDLGYDEVDVVCVDLDETKEKALNIALNKIQGFWDEDKLSELLIELKDTDLDFELTGYTEKDLNELKTITDIDWKSIPSLTDETYKEPKTIKLRCPICNGVDEKIRFKEVKE